MIIMVMLVIVIVIHVSYQHQNDCQGENSHLVVWPSLGKDSSWTEPSAASFAVAAIVNNSL